MENKREKNPTSAPCGVPSPRGEGGAKGFLILECCACGKQKAFCSKKPIQRFECTCGQRTKLDDPVPVYMRCECGKSFRYMTNIDRLRFTANCPHCGSPVELELGNSGKAYITMGQGYSVQRRKKR